MESQKATSGPQRRLKIIGLCLLAAFFVFGVFGYLAGPPIARSVLLKVLAKELHRPVSLGEININPYAMSVRVADLKIGDNAGGETFGFDELFLDLDLASVIHAAPVVEEVRLKGLRVHLAREAAGKYNISDLLDEWLKPSDSPTPSFSVNNIKLTGGRIDFDDKPVGKQHAITEINISLPFISNLAYQADLFTEPAFSAVINGAPLTLAGKTKPFAQVRESELKLELDRFNLSNYLAYLPVQLPFSITGGMVDSDIRLVFRQAPKEPSSLNIAGKLTLRDLHLLEDGKTPLLNLVQLEVPLTAIAPLSNSFKFGSIGLDGLEVFVRVGRDGRLNWQNLAKRLGGEPGRAKPTAETAKTKPSDGKAKPVDAAAKAAPAKPMELSLDGLRLTKATLRWQDGAKPDAGPSARLERFEVKGIKIDAAKQRAGVAEVALNGLELAATRLPDGKIAGLQALAKPTEDGAQAPALRKKADKTAPGWQVDLGKTELTAISLRLDDKAVKPAAQQVVEITRLALDAFSTAPKSSSNLDLALLVNKKGALKLSGPVSLAPLSAKLKLDLQGLELLPLQPYFGEKLNLTVTKGQIASNGELELSAQKDGSLGGGFRGQLTLGNFHSVDKINSADFLTWKSFHLGKINVGLRPLAVAIGDMALTDFYARLIVSKEGKLNVMHLVKKDEAAATPEQKDLKAPESAPAAAPAPGVEQAQATAPTPVRIDKMTLQGGTLSITDNFIKPNYSAKLAKIGGRITGLSSDPGSTADLDLRGVYDGAPLTITGKINPLSPTPALDINTEIRGVELTPMSPYAGKYAGYAIDKGKLSLYLNYKIADRKLKAENRIFLDQLTFGKKVESPDATKLPVTLAISLLQNRKGEIDINLPISGSLDDPQFSVGGIIVQVIVNLLGKAITSPFALIGSLFGGGEELSFVDFAPGRSQLSPEGLKRVETVAKILDDKPSLKLEIAGRMDPEKDIEGLRQASLEHKIKAVKHAQLLKKNKEVGSIDEVVVDDKEYDALLEQAYKLEKFPKPRNFIGLAKSLPREEMEKLMLANAPVGENELRELADARAQTVAEWLRSSGKVPAERIFMLPPKQPGDSGGPKDAPLTRADFSLK